MLTVSSHGYCGGCPYTIHFFIGAITDQEIKNLGAQIVNDPRHAGSIYTFSARLNDEHNRRCASCAKQVAEGAISQAQVPLTRDLLQRALNTSIEDFDNLELDVVKTYLADNLIWKAVSVSPYSGHSCGCIAKH